MRAPLVTIKAPPADFQNLLFQNRQNFLGAKFSGMAVLTLPGAPWPGLLIQCTGPLRV